MVNHRKKLLVLDINGLLLDTYYQGETRPDRPHDAKVNRFYVYKRGFCDEFIEFCLENFFVGVWSSAREHNVHSLVDFMFKEAKGDLAFIWHQQHCTDTGFRHPDNKYKPVFLKELSRLWGNYEPDLPWVKGDYGPSNTLLIDDSPYKAISNPRHTAIFPRTYKATEQEDNYLAEQLLPYLEDLLKARDVQKYIQRNPIGETSISPSDPLWSQILKSGQFKKEEEPAIPEHLMVVGGPVRLNPVLASDRWARPSNLLPANSVMVPPHMSAQPQSRNPAHGERRWRRYERIPQPDWVYNGGALDPHGLTHNDFETGAGPSWPSRQPPRDTSHDLIRKHAMLSGRSSDYGVVSRGADRRYNDFHGQKSFDDRRSSFRDYEIRASGWSEEPEDFGRSEPWHYHQGGIRTQEGCYQGKRKRRVDWTRDPKSVGMDENHVIRIRDRNRERNIEEPYSCQRRASPLRHQQRREENHQFRSRPKEGSRDLQRYTDKELPRKRDLSEDSGWRSQKYDHSNDGSQSRSRRKSGRRDRD